MQRLRTVTLLDVSAVAGHRAMPAALLFFLFHIEIEGKGGWIIGGGGGGGKGYVGPPLKLLGGLPPPPFPTPMLSDIEY